MIDFDYTAPELMPFRVKQVRENPEEPHRIGGIVYVPLVPWDGERYHCILCGAELRGYQRRCACGQRIYGYEDNGARAVLDACELRGDAE
jgi:hypothetical protein